MKICKVCGCDLSTENTYKTNKSHCKECLKARTRQYRMDNTEQVREYDRQRYKNDLSRKEAAKQCVVKARSEGKYAEYQRRHRDKHPDRYKARTAVGNAIRDGRLKKGPCEECGTTEGIEAHHDDYSKPLDIRWLCASHHGAEHCQKGDMQRAI